MRHFGRLRNVYAEVMRGNARQMLTAQFPSSLASPVFYCHPTLNVHTTTLFEEHKYSILERANPALERLLATRLSAPPPGLPVFWGQI